MNNIEIDLKNYDESLPVIKREASKAIIFVNGKLLGLKSDRGDIKLIGGGKENNDLYKSGRIDQGEFGIIWNDEIDIEAESLYYDGSIIERKSVDISISIAIMVTMARTKKGLGQKDLAKITGIHQAEISKIERGIGNPSVKTLDRIAKGLGLNLKLFLE